jgi:class 3 adenylate cyclase
MLNDAFETLTAALRPRGGHVLKFIGDAMLATISFDELDEKATCRRALDAPVEASANLKFVTRNAKRHTCHLLMLISLCTSARCHTATSVRWTGLTSP